MKPISTLLDRYRRTDENIITTNFRRAAACYMVLRSWNILQAASRDPGFLFVYLSHFQDQNGTVSVNRTS